jgi:hypothetical protein
MVVHQKAIFMTVEYVDFAYVDDRERLDIERVEEGGGASLRDSGFVRTHCNHPRDRGQAGFAGRH